MGEWQSHSTSEQMAVDKEQQLLLTILCSPYMCAPPPGVVVPEDAKHLSLQNHGHGRQRTRPVTSKSVRRTRTHCMIIFSERFSCISSSDLQRIYSFIL
ncbi:uncharacterized protein LOC120656442 isoform X2 [Panicum virgatum]|uniref:uncharacterized protein LOC120656442 isoform X2 n=1 Tax=Panicum virgatum TaxID=38727 RepID=UPI0019D5E99B|nr:uncharacterized protein LOC120656442 isoform X2 [Panicum virgatum]